MANEERLAAIRKQQRLNRIREIQASKAAPEVVEETVIEEPEVPEERGLLSDINDRVQAFTQGVTLNSMDEIGSAALAGLKPAINWAAGAEQDDSTYDERYDKYHQQYQDDRERFADENFGEALALEMAGGFLLPGGVTKGLTNATRLQKLARGAKVGAAQGTVAGTMAADQGDRGTGAILGATIGGALPVTMNAVTGGAGTVARRRIAKELGSGDNFTPIHRADKGWLGETYRTVLGRVGGAKGNLIKQDQPFIEAAESGVERQVRELEKNVDVNAARKVLLAKTRQQAADDIDASVTRQSGELNEAASRELADINQGSINRASQVNELVEREGMDQANNFRRAAIDDAMPETMPAELRSEIQSMSPRDAEKRISTWWDEDGFGAVKSRGFEWDGGMKNNIRKLVGSDPVLLNEVGDSLSRIEGIEKLFGGPLKATKAARKGAKKAVGNELSLASKELTTSGRKLGELLNDDANVMIDGAALLEMRNVFARASNKGLSLKGKGKRTIADEFDAMIFKQLGDDGAKYSDELSKWGSKQALSAATRAARKQGRDFSAKDWVGKSRQGDTGLRQLGEETMAGASKLKKIVPEQKAIIQAANAEAKSNAKATLSAAQRAVKDEAKTLKRASAAKGSDRTGAARRLRKAKKAVVEAKKNMAKVKSEAIPKDSSGWSTIMLTSALGGLTGVGGLVAGGPLGAAAGLAAGLGAGKALTGEAGQRLVAGQTGLQGKIRDMAGNQTTRALARRLRQTTAREAAGRAGE